MEKKRSSNIELLRICAMAAVVFLHYFNEKIGGGISLVSKGTVNEHILMVLEMVCICSVDLFVMISGYFLSRKDQRNIGNVLVMFMQVSLYRTVYYCIHTAINGNAIVPKTLFTMLLPANWFIVLYSVLYLLSPLLNNTIHSTNKKKTIIIVVILFSVWPTVVDVLQQILGTNLNALSSLGMYGSERGYTIVNFILCYFVGAYLNELKHQTIMTHKLIIFLILDLILMSFWNYWDASTAREYCNPLIVAYAAVLLLLFLKIHIGENKVINKIASCSLSVYIIHGWLFPYLQIEKYINRHPLVLLAHIAISIIIIVIICFIIDSVYKLIFGRLIRKAKQLWIYSNS